MSDTAVAILLAIKKICEERQLELRHSYLTEAEYQQIDAALAELGYEQSYDAEGDDASDEWESSLRIALFGQNSAS